MESVDRPHRVELLLPGAVEVGPVLGDTAEVLHGQRRGWNEDSSDINMKVGGLFCFIIKELSDQSVGQELGD